MFQKLWSSLTFFIKGNWLQYTAQSQENFIPNYSYFKLKRIIFFKKQPKTWTLQLTVRLLVILTIFPSPHKPRDPTG